MNQAGALLETERAASVLGVNPVDGADCLRAAFLAGVKLVHPDRPGGDAQRLRMVIEAYEILKAVPPNALRDDDDPIAPEGTLEISPTEAMIGGRRSIRTPDGRRASVNLPAGLRSGARLRVAGQAMRVVIARDERLAVIGDHLCLTVRVDVAVLRVAGGIRLETPSGPISLQITRQDCLRGLIRRAGRGLPPRFGRPRGDLLVHLRPAAALTVGDVRLPTRPRQAAV